ncbi:MAG: heavy-metal-associated domain-containing protein [Burkholderiales bacterium]
MQTEIFQVAGMTSEKCLGTITDALTALAGVNKVAVSLLRSEITVQFDSKFVATPQLESALAKVGYTARVVNSIELGQGSCCGGCCS